MSGQGVRMYVPGASYSGPPEESTPVLARPSRMAGPVRAGPCVGSAPPEACGAPEGPRVEPVGGRGAECPVV